MSSSAITYLFSYFIRHIGPIAVVAGIVDLLVGPHLVVVPGPLGQTGCIDVPLCRRGKHDPIAAVPLSGAGNLIAAHLLLLFIELLPPHLNLPLLFFRLGLGLAVGLSLIHI